MVDHCYVAVRLCLAGESCTLFIAVLLWLCSRVYTQGSLVTAYVHVNVKLLDYLLQDPPMCDTFTSQCRSAGKLPIKNANTTECPLKGCNTDVCCEVNLHAPYG